MKICYLPALKLGRVTQVMFCLSLPGQTRFKNYLGLDHVQREIKEYVIWRCNNADVCSSWAMPAFVIVLWCLLVNGSNTPVSYVYVWVKSDHLQVCIEPCPSIDCCCSPRSATLEVFQLHMGLLLCKARALDLCKATPTFLKQVLVPVNLLEPRAHTALCTTPIDPLL